MRPSEEPRVYEFKDGRIQTIPLEPRPDELALEREQNWLTGGVSRQGRLNSIMKRRAIANSSRYEPRD